MELTLYRLRENTNGTFGVLCNENVCICLTLERPWMNNKSDVSCIPIGEYKCKRHTSEHFGEGFEVLNVPNRSDILFHTGNWMTDSKGCIILGYGFSTKNNQEALDQSGIAFDRFMKILKGTNEFDLQIKNI
jgi:hypothetical protein